MYEKNNFAKSSPGQMRVSPDIQYTHFSGFAHEKDFLLSYPAAVKSVVGKLDPRFTAVIRNISSIASSRNAYRPIGIRANA